MHFACFDFVGSLESVPGDHRAQSSVCLELIVVDEKVIRCATTVQRRPVAVGPDRQDRRRCERIARALHHRAVDAHAAIDVGDGRDLDRVAKKCCRPMGLEIANRIAADVGLRHRGLDGGREPRGLVEQRITLGVLEAVPVREYVRLPMERKACAQVLDRRRVLAGIRGQVSLLPFSRKGFGRAL